MIEYIFLILAFPLGYILAKTTLDEKEIYSRKQYFPLIKKILLVLIAATISQNQTIFLTSTFLLITTHTWHKTN
ncbi:hypothetical protein HNV12_00635 [Methanococcoides sp. SA1]|nr:hypothetical protein [Methanococcoides sp. SA1]